MAIKITITNIAEIRAAFKASPLIMTKNLKTAIQRVGLMVGRDSRKFTPVDTGRLRASTYERFYSTLRAEIGTNTGYDTFVHDGTRFMKARPFLQMAVDNNSTNIDIEFKGAVQDTLDEIARKAR